MTTPQGNAAPNGEPSSVMQAKIEGREKPAIPNDVKPGTRYRASILTAPGEPMPTEMAEVVQSLEEELGMQVWLLIQTDGAENMFIEKLLPGIGEQFDMMSQAIKDRFFGARRDLPRGERIALLIESTGGLAAPAYQLAAFLRRHCGGFDAVVPRYAKSAATLLALGADNIVLGDCGELGPLDVQVYDPEREERASALDEVQALDRLHASAMDAFARAMNTLVNATGKKTESLIPLALRFAVEVTQPLLSDLDTVHYTAMSRRLKVGEEYALRLLRSNGDSSDERAQEVVRTLVEDYPEHGFVIDAEEASRIGLQTKAPSPEQNEMLNTLATQLDGWTLIGRVEEVHEDGP